ncbi:MAG: YicC family protein [Phycisphaerae bacterium]|nr:YicC family protein [Phycisphaerae bacterium]
MILSMTGYGEVQHGDDGVSYALELRSLNSRYFKASIKLPEHLAIFEPDIEKLLRTRLSRGTVTCTLRVRDTSAEAAQEVNQAALRSYLSQLQDVLDGQGAVRLDLSGLLALPGVCQPPAIDEARREHQWTVIASLVEQAMDRLMDMRRAEGDSICADLIGQCDQIRECLAAVAQRAPAVLQEYHQRLLQRVNELLNQSKLQLQLDDVKREVALYAERCDINEEVSRLRSHLEQFARLCRGSEQAGRKLDFLAQEMLREANTIGSKSNDTAIAHHIVEIKGAIDRLKEQVQNVE